MKFGFFISAMILAAALVSAPATAKTKTKATQKKAVTRAHAATAKEPTSSYYSLLEFYPYPDRSPGGTENWLRNESAKEDYDGYEAYDNSVKQRQNQITAIPSMGIYR